MCQATVLRGPLWFPIAFVVLAETMVLLPAWSPYRRMQRQAALPHILEEASERT